jgi:hypothetical protein
LRAECESVIYPRGKRPKSNGQAHGWSIYRIPTTGPEPKVLILRRRDERGGVLREVRIR